jgi:hypothetical protein
MFFELPDLVPDENVRLPSEPRLNLAVHWARVVFGNVFLCLGSVIHILKCRQQILSLEANKK